MGCKSSKQKDLSNREDDDDENDDELETVSMGSSEEDQSTEDGLMQFSHVAFFEQFFSGEQALDLKVKDKVTVHTRRSYLRKQINKRSESITELKEAMSLCEDLGDHVRALSYYEVAKLLIWCSENETNDIDAKSQSQEATSLLEDCKYLLFEFLQVGLQDLLNENQPEIQPQIGEPPRTPASPSPASPSPASPFLISEKSPLKSSLSMHSFIRGQGSPQMHSARKRRVSLSTQKIKRPLLQLECAVTVNEEEADAPLSPCVEDKPIASFISKEVSRRASNAPSRRASRAVSSNAPSRRASRRQSGMVFNLLAASGSREGVGMCAAMFTTADDAPPPSFDPERKSSKKSSKTTPTPQEPPEEQQELAFGHYEKKWKKNVEARPEFLRTQLSDVLNMLASIYWHTMREYPIGSALKIHYTWLARKARLQLIEYISQTEGSTAKSLAKQHKALGDFYSEIFELQDAQKAYKEAARVEHGGLIKGVSFLWKDKLQDADEEFKMQRACIRVQAMFRAWKDRKFVEAMKREKLNSKVMSPFDAAQRRRILPFCRTCGEHQGGKYCAGCGDKLVMR